MLKPLALGVLLLLAAAQTAVRAAEVAVMPTWSKGDRISYQLVRSRSKWDGKTETVVLKPVRARLSIEVIAAGEGGSVQRWVRGPVDPVTVPADELSQATWKVITAPVDIELDAHASWQKVRNLGPLRALQIAYADAQLDRIPRLKSDAEARQRMRAILLDTVLDDARFTSQLVSDAALLFEPYGARYKFGVKLRGDTAWTAGDAEVPVERSHEAVQDPHNPLRYRLKFISRPDSRAAMKAGMTELSRKAGIPNATTTDLIGDSMPRVVERSEYLMDRRSAWPIRLSWQRTVELDKRREIETLELIADGNEK